MYSYYITIHVHYVCTSMTVVFEEHYCGILNNNNNNMLYL